MITQAEKKNFFENGFLLLPGVLNQLEQEKVKTFLNELFSTGPKYFDESQVRRPYLFDRHPEIRWLLSHEPINRSLKVLLGDDYGVFMPETVALDSYHFSYWHKDTSAIESLGYEFQWQKDFLVVNTLLYLQENTDEYGGGLDVVPGSHLSSDPILEKSGGYLLGESENNYISIPSKAGDLVIIDIRLTHRATPAKKESPWSRRTISCWCGANTQHINNLRNTSQKKDQVLKRINEYYQKMLRINPNHQQEKQRAYEELLRDIQLINKTP